MTMLALRLLMITMDDDDDDGQEASSTGVHVWVEHSQRAPLAWVKTQGIRRIAAALIHY